MQIENLTVKFSIVKVISRYNANKIDKNQFNVFFCFQVHVICESYVYALHFCKVYVN